MRAAVCRAFGSPLTIEEVTLAPPEANEVEVTLGAVAVCHSDISFLDGKWGGLLPAVYGHEAAGTISAIGADIDEFEVGTRVAVSLIRSCGECHRCQRGHVVQCASPSRRSDKGPIFGDDGERIWQAMATGAFAEKVVVDRSQIVAIPDALPFDQAALLTCGVITGYGAVTRASSVDAQSDVVVIGTGGVGINSIQAAALAGARTVVAVDISDEKLGMVSAFGATHTVNSAEDGATERLAEITEGRGASHVFVTVGVGPAMEFGLACLAPAGELVIVGMPASGVELTFEPVNIAAASQKIIGTKMGESHIKDDIPALIDAWGDGNYELEALISGRFAIDQINEAIDQVRTGAVIRNVIVFE